MGAFGRGVQLLRHDGNNCLKQSEYHQLSVYCNLGSSLQKHLRNRSKRLRIKRVFLCKSPANYGKKILLLFDKAIQKAVGDCCTLKCKESYGDTGWGTCMDGYMAASLQKRHYNNLCYLKYSIFFKLLLLKLSAAF